MGAGLFEEFPELTRQANDILGYSIEALCLEDPDGRLGNTRYTQPALFSVNALSLRARLKSDPSPPAYYAGHSLGEYNALEAAGVITFADALRIVQRRGEIMAESGEGAMAAVVGLSHEAVSEVIARAGSDQVDLANHNSPTQIVISGTRQALERVQPVLEEAGAMFIPLNVSGAFHSRLMQPAERSFSGFLAQFSFATPCVPVISNVTARPYQAHELPLNLARQVSSPVRWVDSIRYLLDQGVEEFLEIGPKDVLTKLIASIRRTHVGRKAPEPAPSISETPPAVFPPREAAMENQSVEMSARDRVEQWNRHHKVGARVKVKGYPEILRTRTHAQVLFGHRAAIYLQGYNGYFALEDVQHVETSAGQV